MAATLSLPESHFVVWQNSAKSTMHCRVEAASQTVPEHALSFLLDENSVDGKRSCKAGFRYYLSFVLQVRFWELFQVAWLGSRNYRK
jgi:hypothetical protein